MHNLRFSCCEYELQDGAPKLVGAYVPMAKRKNLKGLRTENDWSANFLGWI